MFGKKVVWNGRAGTVIGEEMRQEPHLVGPRQWLEVELEPTEREYGRTVWVRSDSELLTRR